MLGYTASAIADLDPIYMNRLTFSLLQMNAKAHHKTTVDMIGVLHLSADGRVYLCESLDASLSWSPNKLEVDKASLEKYPGAGYKTFDRCHVQVSAEYVRDETKDFGIRFGLLKGEHIKLSLSISRVDYADFNPFCEVWNNYVKTSKERGNQELLKSVIRLSRTMSR